ncbi:transcriptional regulator GcvA [Massilia sp. TS11]|uniref:transcriptional regulator GcvA n=1 Tax=Massilia sp. TS11 TaxID=2908003 RepID=UPI001EDB18B2|nr:transcriptional regulator GcvA [Massilia sp. TS11]MCG2585193.1 transcriptional regulator GcvA [Massilia sp. TS11]
MAKLPNFAALRAFEAAARHGNFTRAAEELHLTHGAISHAIRALEDELGLPLFTRNGRHVRVTEEGLRYAQALGLAFADIGRATEDVRAAGRRQRLTVSTITSFAARWLAPRLGGFIERHPEIEVVLQASNQLQDLVREGIDVAIRYGGGHYPGLYAEHLLDDVWYPVVSPHYRGGALPQGPQDLATATLLRSRAPWEPWFRAAGLALPEPQGGLMFEDLSMLIRSAVDGDGVALVRHVPASQEIASGELVRLFTLAVPSDSAYYWVCPPAAMARPQVKAFHTWLGGQVAQFTARS